jgi:hypothetical protein
MNDAKKRISKLAVASLVLALITLPTAGLPLLIGAIVCGHIALRAIKRSQGTLSGRGVAIAGLVISYCLLIAGAIWVPFIIKENNERVATIKQALAEREGETTPGDTATATAKPLPPTRTEEMKQRVDAFVDRGGESGLAKALDENLSVIRQVEERSKEMLAAYEGLDVETIFRPDLATPDKITKAEASVSRLERAAVALKDIAVVHRNTMLEATSEDVGTGVATTAADKTTTNYLKFVSWADSALAFTPLAQRLLKDYITTGQMDEQVVELAFERATQYEEIQEEIVTISAKQQAEFEKTMPR